MGATQFQAMMEAEKSGHASNSPQLSWLATDQIPDALAERWKEPLIVSDTLAMLQYTSGSTSQPKGVMISHGNLMDNIRAIQRAFGMGGATTACSGCRRIMTWDWWRRARARCCPA